MPSAGEQCIVRSADLSAPLARFADKSAMRTITRVPTGRITASLPG